MLYNGERIADPKVIDRFGNSLNNTYSAYSQMIDNYVYIYHLNTYVIVPQFPDSIMDSMQTSYTPSTPLGRSAPIQSFSGAGPRTIQIKLSLHRDLMQSLNVKKSNALLNFGDDYIDFLIKSLKACAYPEYSNALKQVDPPLIAVRFGNDIFCKGIVPGGVSVTYSGPILTNNKYALADISFQIVEIDPYSASDIVRQGSFTGLDTTLERKILSGGYYA